MIKHGGYYGPNKEIIDFSVNLNPLGMPELVKSKLASLLDELANYPEPNSYRARDAIAHQLNRAGNLALSQDNVIMGNGATELIYLFARRFKPKRVLIIQPTFNEYERAFIQSGSICEYFEVAETMEFQLEIDILLATIKRTQPNVVVLCNPNNPTAAYIHSKVIQLMLSELNQYGGVLFIDESFYEFEQCETALPLYKQNIFILRSLTKYYAIAGIRLGYGIGSASLIKALEEIKEPWTLNALATGIVPDLLQAKAYRDKTTLWYMKEKVFLQEELETIPYLNVYPSTTNFFFCRTSIPSDVLMGKLLLEGIFIRTCEDFVGLDQHYIRLTIKQHEDNKKLINALRKQIGD